MENLTVPEDIKQAFNLGYEAAQHDPQLARKLSEVTKNDNSVAARYFQSGLEQYEKDFEIGLRKDSRSNDKGFDKGKL